MQLTGRVEDFVANWRDGGSRCGDLSGRLPPLPARFHPLQNEPQQGNTNLCETVTRRTCQCSPQENNEAEYLVCELQCVSVEQVPAQVDQESVEIDDFLDNSISGSSFLFFNGEVQSAD